MTGANPRLDSSRQISLTLGVAVLAYLCMIGFGLTRRFGHDELFTFYMAQAPTFSYLIEEIQHVDLNPPLGYLVTRYWQDIFGASEFATRLPSAILFLFASLGFIRFLARRIGVTWASAAVVLFWCSPYFQYATEIRPYALLLAFLRSPWSLGTVQPRSRVQSGP